VELWIVDLNSFRGRKVKNGKFEAEPSTSKDLIVVGSKAHEGLLPTTGCRVPDGDTK
jgi:hypothetical protein